ncbi:MAG TPA: RNA polymerase sigma factor [Cyclobacteriaceae bacterium]|jgi:RNA polymerase sigma-70 factor (ECF subfamily)
MPVWTSNQAAHLDKKEKKVVKLLIGCRKHDRSSQKLLYQEFYAYGMSICLRYADNRDEAAEILNDGFMKVFQNIAKFDLKRPFKPWLRRIIVNTAINHYHQKNRALKAEELDSAGQSANEEKVLSGITYDEIVQMLRKLPPAYRTVFNLHVIEGYKHEEIANMLGVSVGTSKSNLFKAKEQLRRILNKFFETDYVDKG